MSERTALYRTFDASGVLLYIGISKNFGTRWKQHARVQPWWPDIQRQTVEWYPDWDVAHAAEVAAIRTENPRFNVMHAVHTEKVRARRGPARRPKPKPAPVSARDVEIKRILIEAQADYAETRDTAYGRRRRAVTRARSEGWSKYKIAATLGVKAPTVDSIIEAAEREQENQS